MISQSVEMAEDEIAVAVAKVHSVALAVPEPAAGCAFVFLHPGAVAVWDESVFPDIGEVIGGDIALMPVASDARACRNGAVGEDGSDRKAGLAGIEIVSDPALIFSEKAFASV